MEYFCWCQPWGWCRNGSVGRVSGSSVWSSIVTLHWAAVPQCRYEWCSCAGNNCCLTNSIPSKKEGIEVGLQCDNVHTSLLGCGGWVMGGWGGYHMGPRVHRDQPPLQSLLANHAVITKEIPLTNRAAALQIETIPGCTVSKWKTGWEWMSGGWLSLARLPSKPGKINGIHDLDFNWPTVQHEMSLS